MSVPAADLAGLVDVQGSADTRNLPIDQAGISNLRLPFTVEDVDGIAAATIIDVSAAVSIGNDQRGAHMSRLVEELESLDGDLRLAILSALYRRLVDVNQAKQGFLSISFPWFIEKAAPVTGVRSSLDVVARYSVSENPTWRHNLIQRIQVPVTTLCPCSKAISDYGAHNQRADVVVDLEIEGPLAIETLAQEIEQHASCELYGILKRPDEKYVTERAYENPRFVEDVVRDVYATLKAESAVSRVRVFVESDESIHNHHAYALIDDWQHSP